MRTNTTASGITHADVSNSAARIEAACGIHDATASFVFAETLSNYKRVVHAINRCRNCEAKLASMQRFEHSMRQAFDYSGNDGATNSLSMFEPYE